MNEIFGVVEERSVSIANGQSIATNSTKSFLKKDCIKSLLNKHSYSIFDQERKIFCLLVFKVWEEIYLSK